MKRTMHYLWIIVLFTTMGFSCQEYNTKARSSAEQNNGKDCGCDGETIRTIENVEVITVTIGSTRYLKADRHYYPCNGLKESYQKNGLKLIVSGEIKKTVFRFILWWRSIGNFID